MSLISEFKAFAMRGNVVDLAIGVVLGVTFGKIVNSLVNDVLMPPLGALLGGVDFSHFALVVRSETATNPAVLIKYGEFINSIIDFGIIAFVVFLVIKAMNKVLPPPVVEKSTKECPECLMTIPSKAKKCGHCLTTFSSNGL